MKYLLPILPFALSCFAETWTGAISDSLCRANHSSMKGDLGQPLTPRECTQACIKKGDPYIFVSRGTPYKLSNQSTDVLAANAGRTVRITGELKGDTISLPSMEALTP